MTKRDAIVLTSVLLTAGLSISLNAALAAEKHRSLTFDGKDDFVVIPSSRSLVLTNGLTLSVRVASGGGSGGAVLQARPE